MTQENTESLARYSDYVTEHRASGNSYYLSARHYPSGDCEIIALKLTSEDQLRKGGGSKRKNTQAADMSPESVRKSISRARTTVRRKLLSMQADRLLTLTFRENLTDLDKAWQVFKYFSRLMRDKFENFRYVAVPEFQARGAVHFHLAIDRYYPVNIVRALWRRASGEYKGNIDIAKRKNFGGRSATPKRIASYISKYITKCKSVEFNRRSYSSGGDIVIPPPIKGWACYGSPIVLLLSNIVHSIAGLLPESVFESDDGYFPLVYMST